MKFRKIEKKGRTGNEVFLSSLTKGDYFEGNIKDIYQGEGYEGKVEDKLKLEITGYSYENEREEYPIEGEIIMALVSTIKNAFDDNGVTIGDLVRLEYLGKQKKKRGAGKYHNFEVMVADIDEAQDEIEL